MAQDNIIKFTDLVDKANTILSKHTIILGDAADNLELLNTKYKELPSQYYNAVKKNLDVQEKKEQSDKKLIQLETKKNQLFKAQIPTLSQLAKFKNAESVAIDKANKEREKEQRLLEKTTGLYNKVQAGINKLTKQYNDLAIRKELGGKLSAQELVSLGRLEAKLMKYQGVLKQVDANIGKHQRNVGNYKSGFDGLGFSVAQLSREMPAFANSMQTGFMAISNNIPMLVDEINKLKIVNKELVATGQQGISIFKSLGKAIFGWQTLISIGVTLLTVYGAKIFETIFAVSEEEKALKEANKAMKEQNEALKENIALRKRQLQGTRDFINNKEALREFQMVLNDLTADSPKAEAVLAELSDRLSTMGLKDSELLKNQDILASDRLRIANNLLQIEEQNIRLAEERNRLDNVAQQKAKILSDFKEGNIDASTRDVRLSQLQSESLDRTIDAQKEIIRLNELNQRIIGKTVEIESKDVGKEKKREKEVSVLKDLSKGTETYRTEIEKLISALEQAQALEVKGSKTYNELGEAVKNLKDSLDPLADIAKRGNDEIQRGIEIDKEKAKELYNLQKATEKYMKTFQSDFFKGAGLGSLEQFFDGSFDKLLEGSSEKWAVYFNGITEVAQEAFNFIANQTQQNFDFEYAILEKRKEIALQFAGEGAAARERIEEQYEAKRKAIQVKQAKAQQKLAIFNTIVNTAQAVVSAIAASPLTLGMPWAGIIAGIGLAQAGFIANQKIPEFKDGVRNFGGGAAIVGDGGVSEIVRTDKGVYATPNKDTLVNLPKGADVFKNHDEYFNSVMNDMGILPSIQKVEASNGLKASEVDAIMGKYFSKIQINELNFDKRGFGMSIKKTNSRTILKNNRASAKGYSV